MTLKLKNYKYLIISFFIPLVFISNTFASQLDENIKRQGFNNISAAIFSAINKDARIALSPVSSLSNKKILPIIISSVHSDIKSSLTEVSGYKVYLVDKTKLEDAWSNAIEFNKLKFDNIIKDAKFDYLLKASIDTSETELLLQVSITSTKGGSVGKVVYDSGLKKIPFNWKSLEGVEIIDQADAAKILDKIKKLEQRNLIIENPKTFEEFYINYKIFSSKNALQDALRSLENAIKIDNTYVDLIDDFINYSFIEYGTTNGVKFIKNKLFPLLDNKRRIYVEYSLGEIDEIFDDCDFSKVKLQGYCTTNIKTVFIPLLNQLIKREGIYYLHKETNYQRKPVRHFFLLESARRIINAEKDGSFSKFFIDKNRAASELQLNQAFNIEAKLNFARYHVKLLKNYIPGNGNHFGFYNIDQNNELTINPGMQWMATQSRYQTLGPLKMIDPLEYVAGSKNIRSLVKEKGTENYIDIINPKFVSVIEQSMNVQKFLLFDSQSFTFVDEFSYINYSYRDIFGPCGTRLGMIDTDMRRTHLRFSKTSKNNGFRSLTNIFKAPYPNTRGVTSKFWPKVKDKEGSKYHIHSFFNPENDRLLWADFCLLKPSVSKKSLSSTGDSFKTNYKSNGIQASGFKVSKNKNGILGFEFPVISNLIITDNVDVYKPIIIVGKSAYNKNYDNTSIRVPKQKYLVDYSISDISVDGTLFDPYGIDLDETQRARAIPPFNARVLIQNNWLNTPGIIQSSIGLNSIDTITYFDTSGRKKTIIPDRIGQSPREDLEFISSDDLYFTIDNIGSQGDENNPNIKNHKYIEADIKESIFSNKKPKILNQDIYQLFTYLVNDPPLEWVKTQSDGVKLLSSVYAELNRKTQAELVNALNEIHSFNLKINPVYSQNLGQLTTYYIGETLKIFKKRGIQPQFNNRQDIKKFFNQIIRFSKSDKRKKRS